jgi:hypothetical protein
MQTMGRVGVTLISLRTLRAELSQVKMSEIYAEDLVPRC